MVIPAIKKKTSYEKPKRWRRQKLEWRKERQGMSVLEVLEKLGYEQMLDKNR